MLIFSLLSLKTSYYYIYLRVSGKPKRPFKKSMPFQRYHLNLLIFIGAVINIVSCGSTSKVVFQYKAPANKIKFFVTENPNYRKGEGKLYARVDSGNVRIFYSFQPDNIFKTYNNLIIIYILCLLIDNPY